MYLERWHQKVRSVPGTDQNRSLFQTHPMPTPLGQDLAIVFISALEDVKPYKKGVYLTSNITEGSIVQFPYFGTILARYAQRFLAPPPNSIMDRFGFDPSSIVIAIPYGRFDNGREVFRLQPALPTQVETLLSQPLL